MNDLDQNYSNQDILNLFYLHGECGKITERTCRLFNERYPNKPTMTRKIFKRIESNFLRYGIGKQKTIRNQL